MLKGLLSKSVKAMIGLLCLVFSLFPIASHASQAASEPNKTQLASPDLPQDLDWQTGAGEPLFASEKAQFGGVFRTYLSSFPQTFRTVGPDSNGSFRAWIGLASLSLLDKHPNTDAYLPSLAQSWALAGDHQTVYFKLNPNARWSDGVPVTAKDFTFMLKLMRSKDIVAPWYNDFYNQEVKDIYVYDDHTIAVVSGKPRSDDELLDYVNLQPRPAHFYANPEKDDNKDGIADDFVRRYNFKPEPVTGPYFLDKVVKGKKLTFKHVGQDWWGYQIPYNQHRFNVAAISIKIIRDPDIARKYFEKGYLDAYALIRPVLWHEKAKGELYDKGYIQKAWGYNQAPVGAGGMWLNTAKPL
ncbi:MAG: ABC transporter substrate-binding protein, partial [Vibrio sp.]